MSFWRGVKWYHELFGNRGLFAIASCRVFGRPRELAFVPAKTAHTIYLRIDTSDFCAYRDVLAFKTKPYQPSIASFSPGVIVDVGAHIGMASILFALEYPQAKVIALEPEAHNFAALVRNTAPYKAITPIQAALWREDGEVNLGPSPAHIKGAFAITENGSQKVRSLTMQSLLRECEIDSIDLLKVDIEGAEKDVFENCEWISKVRVLAIELHDRLRPGCSEIVREAFKDFDEENRGEVTFFRAENARHNCVYSDTAGSSAAPRVPAA